MEDMISAIAEFSSENKNIKQLIMLDDSLRSEDIALLNGEFDFRKDMIDNSIKSYRNLALILKLKKADERYSDEWSLFLSKAFPKKEQSSKFDNAFLGKSGDKILLITNRRLMGIDIKHLNEKVGDINSKIGKYNEELPIEMDSFEHKRGFKDIIKDIFMK